MTNQVIPVEAVEAAAEVLISDSGWCECRHNPREKHDTNPPCSTRRRATAQARASLEAAAPYMLPFAWDEGRRAGQEALVSANPYRPTE